jgi:hypothetical protein
MTIVLGSPLARHLLRKPEVFLKIGNPEKLSNFAKKGKIERPLAVENAADEVCGLAIRSIVQLKRIAAEDAKTSADQRARLARQEEERLAADKAKRAELTRAAAEAKAAEEARLAAEKAKQIEAEHAAAAERARAAAERAAAEKLAPAGPPLRAGEPVERDGSGAPRPAISAGRFRPACAVFGEFAPVMMWPGIGKIICGLGHEGDTCPILAAGYPFPQFPPALLGACEE